MDFNISSRRAFLLGVSVIALNACSTGKIMTGTTAISAHNVDLGFNPDGHKEQEGDGRTPEGQYFINPMVRAVGRIGLLAAFPSPMRKWTLFIKWFLMVFQFGLRLKSSSNLRRFR